MIHKRYQSHKHYLWQLYPRAKSKHSKLWGVYTTCPVIADKIAQRKSTVKLDVIFPNDYTGERFFLFNTEYSEKKYAIKSFNRLLRDNSYDTLKENVVNNEFESLSGCISGDNLEVRVGK